MADDVLREGCITGDRINGLCDGLTGEWYCKFDTFHPAADRGIPVTRVISRMRLQELLVASCERIAGRSIIRNGVKVVSYENTADGVVSRSTPPAMRIRPTSGGTRLLTCCGCSQPDLRPMHMRATIRR